ncbi:hypothetical protein SAMN05216431_1053 [Ligilactobacillus sp. WC1T17]|uniref:ComK protein n=1 Tax=Ligilactobacillus ruminis TaxID=1623 RepID=A0ABY1AB08_9LACO|nr:hypothetical protein SAMN05216431_1053 [Ligilactobacillus ruminis]
MCKTVDLSQTGLAQLLKLALYQPEAAIHPQKTNLILDVHLKNYQHFGPINALIINDYQIIATPKYTKSLINNFIAKQKLGFLFERTCLPQNKRRIGPLAYVWGEMILMPLSGTSRHSTSWVMLNKIHQTKITNNFVLFQFVQGGLWYQLNVFKDTYQANQKICQKLYRMQHEAVGELLESFDFHKSEQIYQAAKKNYQPSSLKMLQTNAEQLLVTLTLKAVYGKDYQPYVTDTVNFIDRHYNKLYA